ncbi:MAG: hypothetical protein QM760_21960 [Nibricoccus sp.]
MRSCNNSKSATSEAACTIQLSIIFCQRSKVWLEADGFPGSPFRVGKRILSLPLFPDMVTQDLNDTVEAVTDICKKFKRLISRHSGMSLAGITSDNCNVAVYNRDPGLKLAGMTTGLLIKKLSVVIPIYNEEANIPALFPRLMPVLASALAATMNCCSVTTAAAIARWK